MHSDHSAWLNGSSKSLHDVLGHAAPGVFILAGITLVSMFANRAPTTTRSRCSPSANLLDDGAVEHAARVPSIQQATRVATRHAEQLLGFRAIG